MLVFFRKIDLNLVATNPCSTACAVSQLHVCAAFSRFSAFRAECVAAEAKAVEVAMYQ
jgi:hypothetical protein